MCKILVWCLIEEYTAEIWPKAHSIGHQDCDITVLVKSTKSQKYIYLMDFLWHPCGSASILKGDAKNSDLRLRFLGKNCKLT